VEREEIRKLRAENFELRRANEILKSAGDLLNRRLDDRDLVAAVFEPALPGRKIAANASPVSSQYAISG